MSHLSTQRLREASHAGSWYTSTPDELDQQLEGFLDAVSTPLGCIGPRSTGQSVAQLPVPEARVIIAPHAGYSYSGPAAAFAYKAWDVSKAKRIFLLGPSHHHYLTKAALTKCTHYATPIGDLLVDTATTAELHSKGIFEWMSQSVDEAEHSLEMHLPYIYKILSRTFGSDRSKYPSLIPIMIGNTSPGTERDLAEILAPYLSDPSTAWVISSDFAHWGSRFGYTYYRPRTGPAQNLNSRASKPNDPYIYESIREVDFECIGECESGSHEAWLRCLDGNGNTVCGRHPIGVILAAIEVCGKAGGSGSGGVGGHGLFRFVRYERSSEVVRVSDSSVSYASAFAVL